jgi:hypothetical protein
MAGGRSPPELFPTDTSSLGEDAEAPLRRQRVRYTSELYAELAALLPGIPRRVRTCSRPLLASSVLGNGAPSLLISDS